MPEIEPQVLMQERPSDDGEAVDDAGPASHPRSALDRRAERGQRLGGSNGAIDLAEVRRGVAVSDLYAGGHSRSLALRRHDEALVDDMNRPAPRRALPGPEMLMIAPRPKHRHVVDELGTDPHGPWPSGHDPQVDGPHCPPAAPDFPARKW